MATINPTDQCIYILDSNYDVKTIIDTFSDLLWTNRYYGYGEFELTLPAVSEIIDACSVNDYVSLNIMDGYMIIETITLHTDIVNGDTLTISGRSLESILERRVILDKLIGTMQKDGTPNDISIQDAVKTVMLNNIVNPSSSFRKIKNFTFQDSSDPVVLKTLIGSFQDRGANLYDKLLNICKDAGIGFRVAPVDGGGFEFYLYAGIDRSWDQEDNLAVVFSDSYENLTDSDYLYSTKDYKTAIYTAWNWHCIYYVDLPVGETIEHYEIDQNGEEIAETSLEKDSSGLSRREIFMNDDSGTYEIGHTMNIPQFSKQVSNKAKAQLSDYEVSEMFEGNVEHSKEYVYTVDYFLGDIVQLANKYGKKGKCRITEVALSWNASGLIFTPTFEMLE